jgi:hypothetical protein
MGNKGLDIGTNMLVAASLGEDGVPAFKMQRDAFYKIVPKSEVNKNSIMASLEKRKANFILDEAGNFVVVGEDALEIAIERNDVAKRPLRKGVLSPKEKDSLPMLKLIIESLIGQGEKGDKIIYSVPARPVDGVFDIVYHTEMMGTYLKQMGYASQPINEAFAISLSELLDEGLTGVCISYGAGMTNMAIIHQGDPLVEFSITRAGDYIDQAVGTALDESPSWVQLEKEAGVNLLKPKDKVGEALSIYYKTLIKYTIDNIVYEMKKRKKELPTFREDVSVVLSGGLTLAEGFIEQFKECLGEINFPIGIKEIRRAKDPIRAVAHGALLAAQL